MAPELAAAPAVAPAEPTQTADVLDADFTEETAGSAENRYGQTPNIAVMSSRSVWLSDGAEAVGLWRKP